MSTWIPSKKWKRKGANVPKNIAIARAKSKKPKVVSRKKAEAV